MNAIISTVLFLIVYQASLAQSWQWAIQTNDSVSSYGRYIEVDHSGNVFVVASSGGSRIIKFNNNGQLLWERKIIGSLSIYDFTIDYNGNLIITGAAGTVDFGSCQLMGANGNAYIAKFDNDGNCLWVTTSAGSGSEFGQTISSDISGNLFWVITFSDELKIEDSIINNPGFNTSAICKLDSDGNLLWLKKACNRCGYSIQIKTTPSGVSYLGGNFGVMTNYFDSIALNPKGPYPYDDVFLAKLNPDGKFLWAKRAGSLYDDRFYDLKIDGNENIFFTGFFETDPADFNQFQLTSNGQGDYFTAKYDSSGNCTWVKNRGAGPIGIDSYGNSYINDPDFIRVLDPSGNYIQSMYVTARNSSITGDLSGNIYCTGYFTDSAKFSGFVLRTSRPQIFVAKLQATPFSVNIENEKFDVEYKIFPNPLKDYFQIDITRKGLGKDEIRLEIFNVFGQTIYSQMKKFNKDSFKEIINLEKLANGIYFIKVGYGETQIMKRLVKN